MERKPVYLTNQGLEKLRSELEHLSTTRRQELSEYMGSAIADGDLRESAAYDEARMLQSANEARIRDLEEIIQRAIVVEYKEGDVPKAQLGAKLVLEDKEGVEHHYFLVGTHEANILENRISDESPVGQALVGHQMGDKVKVKLGKKNYEYKIIDISFDEA